MSAFSDWFGQSDGDWPTKRASLFETDWLAVGSIRIRGSSLEATDLMQHYSGGGVSAPARPGVYSAFAKGATFGSHRRVAAVRLVLSDATTCRRGQKLGEVGVDSWGMVIGDVETWQAGLDVDDINEFNQGHSGRYATGCEIVNWTIAGRAQKFLFSFTGLGSGGYPVSEVLDGAEVVGIECGFITPGYVA